MRSSFRLSTFALSLLAVTAGCGSEDLPPDAGAPTLDAKSAFPDAAQIDADAKSGLDVTDAASDGTVPDLGLDTGVMGEDADGGQLPPDSGIDPTNCKACHGDETTAAPPKALNGATEVTDRGVGAHRSHLRPNPFWHKEILCNECHVVPAAAGAAGHDDSALPAELTFGTLAKTSSASPAFDGLRCSNVYCHGATLLPGGSNTTPAWTTADGSQAACGTCHGIPPLAPHPSATNCGTCHPNFGRETLSFLEPARHIDGVVDLAGLGCSSCHGSDANPAPPNDLFGHSATSERGVGAHQKHLQPGTWHKDVACADCHKVPAQIADRGHADTSLPAELTFGALARADGAQPAFDGVTCASVYCHGGTLLPGGSNTQPIWTTVNGSQAACGTCHGLPPSAPHPQKAECASCHPDVDNNRNITDRAKHIDGVVDVDLGTAGCTACHGSGQSPAPPIDLAGHTATTQRGVGAHQAHLIPSDWHAPVVCTDCHRVPAEYASPGHADTALPAELTFSGVATASGATPSFNGTRCTNVYCHGATIRGGGGSNIQPIWTRVDGTQDACGTCHGNPPPAPHPARTSCADCHMGLDPTRHIDGKLDVDLSSAPCNACHGSAGSDAPPADIAGNQTTSSRGVGAHQAHLSSNSWHKPIACSECHRVPATASAPGHYDSQLPAELTFGPIARADGASPVFNGTRCTNLYCHGVTLIPGGTNTTPAWTVVDGSQDACGTCHGLPPSAPRHPANPACDTCHAAVAGPNQTIAHPELHVDGIVQVLASHSQDFADPARHGPVVNNTGISQCQGCHGVNLDGGAVRKSCASAGCHMSDWQTNCTFCHGGTLNNTGAPPESVAGLTARTERKVGAHTEHLARTTIHVAWTCDKCHVNPASATSPGHIDGDGQAELIFTPLNSGASYDPATGTCASLYCHGDGTRAGQEIWEQDKTMACNSCHPSKASTEAELERMSGKHWKHLQPGRPYNCNHCHGSVVRSAPGSTLDWVDQGLHLNGTKEVKLPNTLDYFGRPCSTPTCWDGQTCSPSCHPSQPWR